MSHPLHRVEPGTTVRLADLPTEVSYPSLSKEDAGRAHQENVAALIELQRVLYAGARHALLVVFQAMDTGGKDGAIRHVFSGVNPQGCAITNFQAPTWEEAAHDFLWRVHARVPRRGMIGVFNRSHYEGVLAERVKGLVPDTIWSRRFDHINAFEELLAGEGVTVLKFFLHISKDEQRKRLLARLADPRKNWKFSPDDLVQRARWDDHLAAYDDALGRCSTPLAPWYVIPADKKWYRNWAVSETVVRTLEALEMSYPKPSMDLDAIVL